MTKPKPPKLFLLDVEGTIAPISLVYDQLFPYARAHFQSFLKAHGGDPGVASDLTMLAEENAAETEEAVPSIDPLPTTLRPWRTR